MMNNQYDKLLGELKCAIETIEKFYDFSYKVDNKKCYPLILNIVTILDSIVGFLEGAQRKTLHRYLQEIVVAMEREDYVNVRDVFHYKLKPLLKTVIFCLNNSGNYTEEIIHCRKNL